MLDLKALEEAGFEKVMTTDEWEKWSEREAERYDKSDRAPNQGRVTKNYMLERNGVLLTTEQNTQVSSATGIQTTIEYPEIAVLETVDHRKSVTCDAGDTELILLLAEELAGRGA